ncbi:hypothetical protein RI367_004779 [Sorochytrium milnesiophthora]
MSNYNWSTVVVTGGGGGLGRGMAESFLRKGKKVIIAGRTEKTLKETCAANPGMEYVVADIGNLASLPSFATSLLQKHPDIDCLVNNAGVLANIDFADKDQSDAAVAERLAALTNEININVTGLAQLTTLMLPHLIKKSHENNGAAAVMFVSSALAFAPLARTPGYCATKAYVHSFALSLRVQLQGTVRVVEIIPPLVDSNIQRNIPAAMQFTKENAPHMQSQEQFLAEFEQDMEQGKDEVAPDLARPRASAWHQAFGSFFSAMNGLPPPSSSSST